MKVAYEGGIVMFGKNKEEKGKVTVVTTKEQLKVAVNRKDSCIEVRGDLVKKMNWMAKLSKKKIAIVIAALTGTIATAPVTAGVSLAAGTVVSTEVLVLTALLGTVVVIAILSDYSIEADVAKRTLRLTKNK